ncbi:ead/Ea22-like family protein [Citrobacter braakii]|uniref:ead/Ea22-like family protein n=1 Tax=Citrobacter braakii TaxID=57706 RepID=UPI00068B95FD|nr:ead/Ea22-like family protein [Citrobacter braakii]
MTDSPMKAFNKQTLREAATEATQGEWYVDYDFDVCHESGAFIAEAHGDNLVQNAKFIAAANPATVLALLDELEATKHTAAVDHEAACSLVEENEELKRRIAELEARTVCLPKLPVLGSTAEWYEGFAAGASGMRNECADAIRAAGIGVKGE